METILLKGARLVDPVSERVETEDLLLCEGLIKARGTALSDSDARVIDMSGKTIFPGFVDLHVHLREPGQEYKETIASGGAAAAHGGVTALLSMPNTNPPIDTVERFRFVAKKAAAESPVDIYQAAALSLSMKGEELVDIEALIFAGVRAFSEDGKTLMNAALLKQALQMAGKHDVPICEHCEDPSLVAGGVMHDGTAAQRLGLPGISSSAEEVITARDCLLALETDAPLHLCHVSTARAVDIVRTAKALGGRISAEACPHHYSLSDEDIPSDDGIWKVNPPLRSRADVEAVREGLADGTLSCISTDHAPHAENEKHSGFLKSAFGMSGIELSAALCFTKLVKSNVLSLPAMAQRMSTAPARVLGIGGGTLEVGAPADLCVMDLEASFVVDPADFLSQGKNTPFAGDTLCGKVVATIKNGRFVYGEWK